MRRSRRLPPRAVSHLETHHAYISPPLPEKGGLPTIIVTPAESDSISDFEIHFYSPKPTQTTFPSLPFARRSDCSRFDLAFGVTADGLSGSGADKEQELEAKGYLFPRIKSLFQRGTFFGQAEKRERTVMEKDSYPESESGLRRSGTDLPRQSRWAGRRSGGYVSLPRSEDGSFAEELDQDKEEDYEEDEDVLEGGTGDIHGVPTVSEHEWHAAMMTMTAGPPLTRRVDRPLMGSGDSTAPALVLGARPMLMTRRARMFALCSIPIALLVLHLLHHQFGWFFSPSDSVVDGRWEEPPTTLSGPSF